jgi:hypothetical protein
MRAEGIDETDHTIAIAKGQEVFAKQAHAHRCTVAFGDFLRENGRLPVAAEKLASGRSRAHPDKAFVLLSRQHGVLSFKRFCCECICPAQFARTTARSTLSLQCPLAAERPSGESARNLPRGGIAAT